MATTAAFTMSGWVGNVIVTPEHRGRGIGRRLVEACLERLDSLGLDRVLLDGDPPGVLLYRSLGFVAEHDSCRAVGHGPWPAAPLATARGEPAAVAPGTRVRTTGRAWSSSTAGQPGTTAAG
jgi:GNAT superfamily N-acetyltransferase